MHGARAARAARAPLKRVLDHGLRWLAAIAHPDGGIPFFNDAAFDVAPTPTQIRDYAGRFLALQRVDGQPPPILCLLAESGFAAADLGDDCKLLADIGSIGPEYQPGHAHAETLAFELSIHGQRVFVNSGTSTYEPGPERRFERSTAAHNTVEVAGRDSSEVWAAFRVGHRARVFDLQTSAGPNGVEIAASHDGYRHLPGRPVHRRTLHARPGAISVADEVSSPALAAVARFHLHPAVEIGEGSTLRLPDRTVIRWSAEGGPCRITKGRWRPCFGREEPNHCIEVPLLDGRQRFSIRWDA